MSKETGKFKIIKVTKIDDLIDQTEKTLPESDLTIQSDTHIIQFEHEEIEKKVRKTTIKPGCFIITDTSMGVILEKFELRDYNLLKTIDNTSIIINERDKFFNSLDVYKELKKDPKRAILLCSPPGVGKCLHPEQKVIMYDGSFKKAKNVLVGDKLLGPDSKARNVLETTSGVDEMFEITSTKGLSYIVNKEHVLSLRNCDTKKIVNISVKEYLEKSDWFKSRHMGYSSDVVEFNYDGKELPIDPYILGLWLGDGCSESAKLTSMDDELIDAWSKYGEKLGLYVKKYEEDSLANTYHLSTKKQYGSKNLNYFSNSLRYLNLKNNKHIPFVYKTHSVENRRKLLAGLIDSDGCLQNNCFDIVQKNEKLLDDIIFISRSLGLSAYKNKKIINGSEYFRTCISGDLTNIPVKLDRKKPAIRRSNRNNLNTSIKVKSLGLGEYAGFELDSDSLFLLDDFTVTHNSSAINEVCKSSLKEEGTAVVVWDTSEVRATSVNKFFLNRSKFNKNVKKLIMVIEDIEGGTVDDDYGPKAAASSLLNFLDGVGSPFKGIPTFIIATTNNPEKSVGALIDRPGRFDKVIEMKTPNAKELGDLLKFIMSKEDLSEEELLAAELAAKNEFSIAHIQEAVVRSKIDKISVKEAVEELVSHKKRFKEAFTKAPKRSLGLNT